MLVHVCNPSFQDIGASGLKMQGFPGLNSLLQASLGYVRFCSENQPKRKQKGTSLNYKCIPCAD